MTPEKIIQILSKNEFDISNEKNLQNEIFNILHPFGFEREYRLSNEDIIDFFFNGIGIEVKIKGPASSILRQCKRYCQHEEIKSLILATSWSVGWPEEINGKPSYYHHLSLNLL